MSYQSTGFQPHFSGVPQYSRTSRQSHAAQSQTSRTNEPPVTTTVGNEVPSFVAFPAKSPRDDSLFKPAPLHLSETNDSDASSSNSERRSTSKSTERFTTAKSTTLKEPAEDQEDEIERKQREEELVFYILILSV